MTSSRPSRRRPTVLVRLVALFLVALLVAPPFLVPSARAQSTEADVYVAQAVLDFSESKYDEALANLRKALEIEPEHVEALYFTGVVLMARSRPAEAVPYLERARARSKTDPVIAFQLGLAYFAQQQYDRAEPLLEEAFRSQPTLDGLGYYVGFLRYRKKDYRGALDAFRTGRTTSQDLQQLTRFYAGLALGVLGLPGQAAAEIEQAIRLVPASPLTGPAERLRDTMVAARQGQRRLTIDARLGFFYDDNVAVVPDRDSREPLVEVLRHPKSRSTGELFGVRADYAWLRTDQWESTIGYSFFTTYNNELPSFNIMSHLASVGLTYRTALGNMPLLVGGQYAFDILFLDQEEFLLRHTASAFASLVESDRYLTQLFARYQSKNFEETADTVRDEIRDADNWMLGVTQLFRFAEDRHYVKVGYQFDWDDTVGGNYEYLGHRILAGAQYTLPWHGIRLKYDFDVHFRDYTRRNSLLPSFDPGTKRREDREITNVVRGELPLPRNFTLAAEYQSSINNSNIAVFDYTRDVFSLILSWAY
jgi:tetratricopeptide (TPR) repeat protein